MSYDGAPLSVTRSDPVSQEGGSERVQVNRPVADDSTANRIRGAMLGLACGDAVGSTLEFRSRTAIRSEYGRRGLREMVGGGWLGLPAGATTDDTDMTLCVAEGILAVGNGATERQIVNAVGERYLAWVQTNPPDVGMTVRLALDQYRRTGSWEQASHNVLASLGDQSAGNGALMRTLPVSFFWPSDPERTLSVSRTLTAMTHPASTAAWCSAFYNLLVRELLAGEAPQRASERALDDLARLAPDLPHQALGQQVGIAATLSEDDVTDPTGYCLRTLVAALWAFFGAQDAEAAIVRAVNLGGDSDTVGAVAGGLAGAFWGGAKLPERWRSALLERDLLDDVIARILCARRGHGATGNVD